MLSIVTVFGDQELNNALGHSLCLDKIGGEKIECTGMLPQMHFLDLQ